MNKSEVDKECSYGMGGLPSRVKNEFIFRMPFVMSLNMAEAVTRDIASSDWLKLAALCLFRKQSVSKNRSICDFAGARPQSDQHS